MSSSKKYTKKARNHSSLLNTIKKGKYIAKGMMGTVYLASDDKGNTYAYKIGKMLPRDVKKSLKSEYWRENDFAENLANKYPDQFMQLYDSRIDPACDHKQDFSGFDFKLEDLPKSQQNFYRKLDKSKYCSIKLWSLIDGDLKNLLKEEKISKKEFYDIYIQIIYIAYLMNKSKYFHNDFHPGNIGYTRTNKKFINILGHNIPTHGYLMKAIDYGLVLHDKYPMTKGYRAKYENDNDLYAIFDLLSFNVEIDKKQQINGKYWNWNKNWFEDILKLTKDEIEEMKQYLPTKLNGESLNKDKTKFLTYKLFKLINYEKWQRRSLKDNELKGVPPDYMIPLEAILYLVKNIYDPEKVLKYLIDNRKRLLDL